MTLEELRYRWPLAAAEICNGVGPKFAQVLLPRLFKRWLRRWENEVLYDAGCDHDRKYFEGGGYVEKKAADLEFGAACYRKAAQYRGWKRFRLVVAAWVDLHLVESWAGWLAWNRHPYPDLVRKLNEMEAALAAKGVRP